MVNKDLPLVSIIMPSYNHGRFISKSIDSIIAQTYTNWELIIIDNNSLDNTKKVLEQYKSINQIKILFVNNNGLIGYSRNRGLKFSKGEIIAFIDSDDIWYDNKLSHCIPYLNKYDLIYHETDIFINSKQKNKKSSFNKPRLGVNVTKDLLLNGNPIVNSSVITKKSILSEIGGINETKEINRRVDYHTWLKISTITNKFIFLNQVLGKNIIHESNLSNRNMTYSTKAATNEFKKYLNFFEKKTLMSSLYYIDNKYHYDIQSLKKVSIKNLLYSIIFGRIDIKIKSIYLLYKVLFS